MQEVSHYTQELINRISPIVENLFKDRSMLKIIICSVIYGKTKRKAIASQVIYRCDRAVTSSALLAKSAKLSFSSPKLRN
jgi:hypothetical protein